MASRKRTPKKKKTSPGVLVPIERIEKSIYIVRGEKVMFDEDLAELYGVTTSRVNEQVTRNQDRFPDDFAFRLSLEEFRNLKSQSATSSWGGRRKPPRVFTEHGAVMAASVLNTPVAVDEEEGAHRIQVAVSHFSPRVAISVEELPAAADGRGPGDDAREGDSP